MDTCNQLFSVSPALKYCPSADCTARNETAEPHIISDSNIAYIYVSIAPIPKLLQVNLELLKVNLKSNFKITKITMSFQIIENIDCDC